MISDYLLPYKAYMGEIMKATAFYLAVHINFVPKDIYIKIISNTLMQIGAKNKKSQFSCDITDKRLLSFWENTPKKYIKNKERALKFINSYKGTHEPKYYDGLFKAIGDFSTGK